MSIERTPDEIGVTANTDLFHELDDDEPIPENQNVIVSLQRLEKASATLLELGCRLGVRLAPEEELDRLVPYLQHLAVVALELPRFRDNGDHSSATLLRAQLDLSSKIHTMSETEATLFALQFLRTLSTQERSPKHVQKGGLTPSFLRRACDYMMARLATDVPLREVAKSVGLSSGHFAVAFKQSLGVTPYVWLRRMRIERAITLIQHDKVDLTAVALAVGYANQSAFGVAFKKETGLTPGEWRRTRIS